MNSSPPRPAYTSSSSTKRLISALTAPCSTSSPTKAAWSRRVIWLKLVEVEQDQPEGRAVAQAVGNLAGEPLEQVAAVEGPRQRIAHRRLFQPAGEPPAWASLHLQGTSTLGPSAHAGDAAQRGAVDVFAVDEKGSVERPDVLEHVDAAVGGHDARRCAAGPGVVEATGAGRPRPSTVVLVDSRTRAPCSDR